MSESESVSAEDVKALRQELADLRRAHDELRAAQTPVEKEEAREEIADASDEFEAVARKAGLSREQIASAVAKARDEEDYGKFKRMMDRWTDELPDDDDATGGGHGVQGDPENGPTPSPHETPAAEKPKREPKPKDTEPTAAHWSERSVSEMLR